MADERVGLRVDVDDGGSARRTAADVYRVGEALSAGAAKISAYHQFQVQATAGGYGLVKSAEGVSAAQMFVSRSLEASARAATEAAEKMGLLSAVQSELAAKAAATTSLGTANPFGQQGAVTESASRGWVRATESSRQYAAAARNAGQATASGASHGAMALMMLGQTIDDAQYGFRAIVNQVPMLASVAGQALGFGADAAMKFGGAMAIAAVAVNLNLQRADEWRSLLKGTALDLDNLADSARGVAEAITGWDLSGKAGELKAAFTAAEKERAERAEAGRKAIEGVRTEADTRRAAQFAEALKAEEGGGRGFRERELARRTSGMTEGQLDQELTLADGSRVRRRDMIERTLDDRIEAAMRGDSGAVAELSSGAGGAFQARIRNAEHERAGEERRKAGDDNEAQLRGLQARGQFAAPDGDATSAAARDERERMTEAERRHVAVSREVVSTYEHFTGQVRAFGVASHQAQAAWDAHLRALREEKVAREEAAEAAWVAERGEAASGRIAARRLQEGRDENERILGGAEKNYGGAFGSQIVAAMTMAGARGEDPAEVDARLQQQLEGRMRSVPEGHRGMAAARVVEQARQRQQAQEAQRAMLRDVYGPLADPTVRLRAAAAGEFGAAGVMQAQMASGNTLMGRMGRQVAARQQAMQRRGLQQQWERFGRYVDPQRAEVAAKEGPKDPAEKVEKAGDQMTKAAEKIERAADDLINHGVPSRLD